MVMLPRRGYSDEDLNNALQDILTRKVGTRKAALQYNVPRSTLRNKVNKLTLEAKRNNSQPPAELIQLQLELDRDVSSEEGDSDVSATSTPQPAELSLPSLSSTPTEAAHKRHTNSPTRVSPQAQLPVGATTGWHDQNMLLRTLLLTMGARLHPNIDENMTLRDFISILVAATTANVVQDDAGSLPNNSKQPTLPPPQPLSQSPNVLDQRLLMQLLQQQQQQPTTLGPQQPLQFINRLPKSETPETTSSLDLNDTYDDPASTSSILKIPSFKPVAGVACSCNVGTSNSPALCSHHHTSSNNNNSSNNNSNNNNSSSLASSSRNGNSPHSAASPQMPTSSLLAAAVSGSGAGKLTCNNNISVISPTLLGLNRPRQSQSPPLYSSLRDVIVSKFQRTLNEPTGKEPTGDCKKPSISVVKNIGGTDTSRFGAAPNLLAAPGGGNSNAGNSPSGNVAASTHNSHHHHVPASHLHTHHTNAHHLHHQLSRQEAAALAAGKGTRPKRGKYRNYDRDSLIEAVKAVQRGEMSVHRAGSYYGVPHSTLEYKVKERHLMRPRKREPKPQPGLEVSGSSGSATSVKNNANMPGLNSLDKSVKSGVNSSGGSANSKLSSALKNNNNNSNNNSGNNSNSSSNSAAANGMKLAPHNMFDTATIASHMQYPGSAAHLFWPHTQAAAAAFGPLAHIDFTTRMQRYQEDMLRAGAAVNADEGRISPACHVEHLTAAEPTHHNGASLFLDGIIRQTLDRKSERELSSVGDGGGGALLDQLLVKKTPLPFNNNNRSQDGSTVSDAVKRLGSPLAYSSDIKRERNSPNHSSDDDDTSHSGAEELSHEHNNSSSGSKAYHVDMLKLQSQNTPLRSRVTSRDSEADASSTKSELLQIMHHNHNNNNKNNTNTLSSDYNGNEASKNETESLDHPTAASLAAAANVQLMDVDNSSILHEKLAQIKAEQDEENL